MSILTKIQNFPLIQKPLDLVSTAVTPLAPLVTRIFLGVAFAQTGYGKLNNLKGYTKYFGDLGIPAPGANAVFIATLETVGGAALLLGLGTRFFAGMLSCTMIVALMTADRAAFIKIVQNDGAFNETAAFVYLMFLAWLTAYGAGLFSVDRLLTKFTSNNSSAAPSAKGGRS